LIRPGLDLYRPELSNPQAVFQPPAARSLTSTRRTSNLHHFLPFRRSLTRLTGNQSLQGS